MSDHFDAGIAIERLYISTSEVAELPDPVHPEKILPIEKARKMINAGYPIVEAALEAGFYDQSHFHHRFYIILVLHRANSSAYWQ